MELVPKDMEIILIIRNVKISRKLKSFQPPTMFTPFWVFRFHDGRVYYTDANVRLLFHDKKKKE